MNKDSNSSDSSPLLDKPWFREAYKSALKFYEKDNELDAKDRLELSNSYRSIARAELWGGWFGFSSVFLTPFAYQFYKTNAIKGVRVPRNFMLGLLAMFGTTQMAGNYMYSRKLNALDPNGEIANVNNYGDEDTLDVKQPQSRSQRQYEMMKLLNNGSASRWAAYFYMTYNNPARRLPNPKAKLEELKNPNSPRGSFLNQRDPMGLYSGPSFDKKEGVPLNKRPEYSVSDGEQGAEMDEYGSSWDKVRQQRSTSGSSWNRVRQSVGKKEKGQEKNFDSPRETLDDDPFEKINEPTQAEFDSILEKERNGDDK